jgi:peptidoglycan/xylan/chitin deacetylase (PgdA/CDA1 family)
MELTYYTHGRRDEPKVALTFDDGPNPPRTDEVLDILANAGVRATFFVIGKWVTAFPQAFERVVRAGHVIGNHSYEHQYHVSDYDKAETVIANITGRRTIFARPHAFDFGAFGQTLLAQLPTTRIVDSDVNPADYSRTEPETIVRLVLEHESLDNGSIIDLHDGAELDDPALRLSRPLPLIEALPTMIDGLKAKGFTLVGLDEMTLDDPQTWSDISPDRMVFSPTAQGVVHHPH